MTVPVNVLLGCVWDTATEALAGPSSVSLLITAPSARQCEGLARKIHYDSARSGCPFLVLEATDFPCDPPTLRTAFQVLMRAAAGGTVLLANIDSMSPPAQVGLAALIAESKASSSIASSARLVSATTVSLSDLVLDDKFSGVLFYRLNLIHIVVNNLALPLAS